MANKKQTRETFRSAVFQRDNYTCQICNTKRIENELDAHHITNRDEFEDGGYILENGITVCKDACHLMCELFHISNGEKWNKNMHPNDLYKKINSSLRIKIPQNMDTLGSYYKFSSQF